MIEPPVLVISTLPRLDAAALLQTIRARHAGAHLVLLAGAGTPAGLRAAADEVWTDGQALGPKRFLALMRRISWMGFAVVYDLDETRVSRFMRLCVWPRAQWKGLSL